MASSLKNLADPNVYIITEDDWCNFLLNPRLDAASIRADNERREFIGPRLLFWEAEW